MQTAVSPKCVHGVHIIAQDKGLHHGPDVSEHCSLCRSQYPDLDPHFGVSPLPLARPKTLSDVYELWLDMKNDQTYEMLFHGVRNFAQDIAKKMFGGDLSVPNAWHEASNDAASTVMLRLSRVNPDKGKFSTWAHKCVQNALLNWRKGLVDEEISLDDDAHPVDAEDTHASPYEKVFLTEIKALLTEEERHLFEMKAFGLTTTEMGRELGISHQRVSERYAALEEKIRLIAADRKPSSGPATLS